MPNETKPDNRRGRADTREVVRQFKKTARMMLDMADLGVTRLDRCAALYTGAEPNPLLLEGLCSAFNAVLRGTPVYGDKIATEFTALPGYILMKKFLTREEYTNGLGEHNVMTDWRKAILRVVINTPTERILSELRTPTKRFGALVTQ